MKAAVLYYSHKGKTANYAREISMFLWSKGCDVSLSSISDFDMSKLRDIDLLLLGCWTSGYFVIHQHPGKRWKEFADSLRNHGISDKKILLFTTYKIRTGSMFSNMEKAAGIKKEALSPRLKSRSGFLSESDKKELELFISIKK